MIPASKLLYVLIAFVFLYESIKLYFREKVCQLAKNVFTLIHGCTDTYRLLLPAKLASSNP